MKNNIIIEQPWGGLGDNLAWSTLPELYTKKGFDVYISKNNIVRNSEIFDLVWKNNPYIKGIIDNTEGILIGANQLHLFPPDSQNEYFIHRIELANNFIRTNYYPKIYYIPKYIESFKNYTIIDLTGTSQFYDIEKYMEYINYFVPLIKNDKYIYIITFSKFSINNILFNNVYNYLKSKIENIEYLTIDNIFDYCDLLNNCEKVIIVNSGINSLVSAIKQDNNKPYVLCYNVWSHFTDEQIKGYYHYKNIEYFKSKI